MKTYTCAAPGCDTLVVPDKNNTYVIEGTWPFLRYQHFCPVCNERLTSGKVSDNDSTTNPDLT